MAISRTPWQYRWDGRREIVDADGAYVATVLTQSDAIGICNAVNLHDELLAALERALIRLDDATANNPSKTTDYFLDHLRLTIAKAKEAAR